MGLSHAGQELIAASNWPCLWQSSPMAGVGLVRGDCLGKQSCCRLCSWSSVGLPELLWVSTWVKPTCGEHTC